MMHDELVTLRADAILFALGNSPFDESDACNNGS